MGALISSPSSYAHARYINDSGPVAAKLARDLHNIDGFRLLDLPTDLLHRILSLLQTETLTTVRRTCKALDAVTFDRFADAHFAHIYCWIYTPDALERLKDILQNAPRLRERIRQVTLTDSYLEDRTINDMYIVEKENEHISNRRFDTAHAYLHAREYKSAESSLVHRVLLDLQRLPQEISIGVDLSNHYPDSERYRLACLATFFSLTTSRTSVHSLAVDDPTFSQVDDLLAHDRAGLMASLSTIHYSQIVHTRLAIKSWSGRTAVVHQDPALR